MYNSKYVKDFDLVIYHDSIETEIEADENAWRKMFQFILKFRTNYGKLSLKRKNRGISYI